MTAPNIARATDRARDTTETGGTGHATAKAILLGEHAVVYGQPAIAVPVRSLVARARVARTAAAGRMRSAAYTGLISRAPERVVPTVIALHASLAALGIRDDTVSVEITSDIPRERGLGSSAAVAAAVVDAVADAFGAAWGDDERHELVQAAERAAHGSPSGLDARAVRASGPVWFQAGRAEPIEVGATVHLVIADTGVRGRTRHAVGHVAALRAADPARIDGVIAELGALVASGRDDLRRGALEDLGAAMNRAQQLLEVLGVSHPALHHLAVAARRSGALGAKLTGGGQGGCLIALAADQEQSHGIAEQLRAAGAAAAWQTTVETTR